MAMKILVVDTNGFKAKWAGSQVIKIENISNEIPEESDSALFVFPQSLRDDPNGTALLESGASLSCLYVPDDISEKHLSRLQFLASPRATGVKNCLAKGSTIFSETFFQAGKVGERLDPCFRFARGKLNPRRAVDTWSALHSMLFLGIGALPEQGEKGTGERVDVQIGADADVLAFTVRFDLAEGELAGLRAHPLLALPRRAADFFELRYLQDAKKVEVLALIFIGNEQPLSAEAHTFHAAADLEAQTNDYVYQSFGSLAGDAPAEKRVIKGGFKKKFSEAVATISPTPATPEEVTVVKGGAPAAEKVTVVKATPEKIVDADNGNFLVSGEVLQTNQKVVVSGAAGMGKKGEKEAVTVVSGAAAPAGKSDAILSSKIEGLETTLKQRDELIAKLNKEIEEIKDPMKMGVISGIKDNQLEGLKGNIARLTGELQESEKREKELMGVVDKAVQMKDDAIKKYKAIEAKLSQSQGGNNSKVVTLEKQLEEQKRQNKELSKRLSQLVEESKKAA